MTAYFRLVGSDQVIATETPQYWSVCDRLPAKEGARLVREQALAELHTLLKPSDMVYCVLRHVSASGMSRAIDFFVFRNDRPHCISGLISEVTSYKRHRKHAGLDIGGCGMDMGFHVVYTLGATMWQAGTPEPHGIRNGEPDSDGGYALKHAWL